MDYMKGILENRLNELEKEVKEMNINEKDLAYEVFWKDEIEFVKSELAKNE